MASFGELPFGLREVKLTPLGADGKTPGTAVKLPVARTLSFSETVDTEELRGDDQLQAEHDTAPVVEWELEAGGISLDAYAVFAGGAVTSSGVTPSIIKTYKKLTTDSRPYFKIEGRAISDSGGDVHALIYRAKTTDDIEGEFSEGSFFVTSLGGKGYASLETSKDNMLYDFIQNETATAIA